MARSSVLLGGVEAAFSGSNSISPPLPPPLGAAFAVAAMVATARAAKDRCFTRRIKLLRCRTSEDVGGEIIGVARVPVKAGTIADTRSVLRLHRFVPRHCAPSCTETGHSGHQRPMRSSQPPGPLLSAVRLISL